jgi:hypothetical protein
LLTEPTEENLARRQYYLDNFPAAHVDLFTNSSGKKPLGSAQIDSANHTNRILKNGGKILKLEPRGFGKTTRLANEFLLAILGGIRSYALISAASSLKGQDILDQIISELVSNEELYKLFPKECEAFINAYGNPARARHLHVDGEPL